jgi:hypothetical protein
MSLIDVIVEDMAGITADELTTLKAALPVTAELVELSRKFEPIIAKAGPLVDELLPLYQQAKPLIAQAIAEWKQIAPAVTVALRVIAAKTKQGSTLHDAVAQMADEYAPQAEI